MSLQVIQTIEEMQAWSRDQKQKGFSIGFVPTMGCLHEGHLSLIREAQSKTDLVVVSIFVNPTQFAPDEDLDAYPKTWAEDKAACEVESVAVIFYPAADEMYPANASTWVVEEQLSQPLCGERRPTHFRGVTTVVTKLFNAVLPDLAVFGQKDAQQALVIERMVRDLNMPIEIVVAPIVRESDGLAMSSRNRYLSDDERRDAVSLSKGMRDAEQLFRDGERMSSRLIEAVKDRVGPTCGVIDYIEIRDLETLEAIDHIDGDALLAAAVYFGKARLLDNCVLR